MHPVGWHDQKTLSIVQRGPADEAHEPSESRIRYRDPVSENGASDWIRYAEKLRRPWTHKLFYLNLPLTALDENEKNDDKEDPCNNANDCGCIHAFS